MKKITIRFPDTQEKIFKAIKESAEKNHRSLNGEILRALEIYLKTTQEKVS